MLSLFYSFLPVFRGCDAGKRAGGTIGSVASVEDSEVSLEFGLLDETKLKSKTELKCRSTIGSQMAKAKEIERAMVRGLRFCPDWRNAVVKDLEP
jgi:hypothetical protein